MIINHNIPSLNTYRSLTINHENTNKSLAKLSSGLRINNAGDDAAGLAISEKMRSQIRGLDQASRNAYDGKSLLQTAEGALAETHSILQRMKELAVQSANDTNTQFDRSEIQKEIEQLKTEIDRISRDTEFNTMKLLDGTMGATADVSGKSTFKVDVVGIGVFAGGYTLTRTDSGTGMSSVANVQSAGVAGTASSSNVTFLSITKDANNETVNLGALYGDYRLDVSKNLAGSYDLTLHGPDGKYQVINYQSGAQTVTFGELGVQFNFSSTAGFNITDSGYVSFSHQADQLQLTLDRQATATTAASTVKLTVQNYNGGNVNVGGLQFELRSGLVSSGGEAVRVTDDSIKLHVGANEGQVMNLSVLDASSKSLGVNLVDLTSQKDSEIAITWIDRAINRVSSERSKMGAIMNRLDHTIKNLGTTSENLTSSESRIRDVDMAREIMDFTKNNILSQASQSMLAQANMIPQGILGLLP
jgi:flagellin